MRDRGLACGGGAGGQKAGGATPVRKVSRHALRFAASSGQRVLSMRNISSALKMERPYVMDGEPIGRRWGTHAESKAAREPRLVRHAADVSKPPELPGRAM